MVDKEDKIKERNVNDCRIFLSNGGETQTNTEDISYDREREEDTCEESNDRETCINRSLEESGQLGLETGSFSPQHKFSTMVANSRAVNSLTVCSYGKIQEDRENEIMDDEIKRNGKKEEQQTEEYEEKVEKKEEQQTEEYEEEVEKKEEQQTEEYEEEVEKKEEQQTEEYEEEVEKKEEQQTEEYEEAVEKKEEQQTEEYEEEVEKKEEQQTEEHEEEVEKKEEQQTEEHEEEVGDLGRK